MWPVVQLARRGTLNPITPLSPANRAHHRSIAPFHIGPRQAFMTLITSHGSVQYVWVCKYCMYCKFSRSDSDSDSSSCTASLRLPLALLSTLPFRGHPPVPVMFLHHGHLNIGSSSDASHASNSEPDIFHTVCTSPRLEAGNSHAERGPVRKPRLPMRASCIAAAFYTRTYSFDSASEPPRRRLRRRI